MPKTKSPVQLVSMLITCLRCGHMWFTRTAHPPKACPACKSYKWQVER